MFYLYEEIPTHYTTQNHIDISGTFSLETSTLPNTTIAFLILSLHSIYYNVLDSDALCSYTMLHWFARWLLFSAYCLLKQALKIPCLYNLL